MSSSTIPTDLYWAAGFLEGEGHFAFYTTTPQIQACQVKKEPLLKLVSIFGGKLHGPYKHKNPRHSEYYEWYMAGAKAIGIMMTLFSLMSPYRQSQIKLAINKWRARPQANRYKTHCIRNHQLPDAKDKFGRRHCQPCNTIRASIRRRHVI